MLQTKLMSKKRPTDSHQVYVAIDFEAIDTDKWWTCSVIVSNFPEGQIIEQFTIGVDRSEFKIQDDSIREFWLKHSDAFAVNTKIAGTRSEEVAEKELVKYVLNLKRKYHNFFLISDNPSFDVRLLDNILAIYGEKSMSLRLGGDYFQCIDTWSYRLSTQQLLNFRSHELSRVHGTLQRPVRPVTRFVEESGGLRHTPTFDAMVLTSQYFKVKDVVASHRRGQHHQHNRPQSSSYASRVNVGYNGNK
jgi:hypothetical protein